MLYSYPIGSSFKLVNYLKIEPIFEVVTLYVSSNGSNKGSLSSVTARIASNFGKR